MRLHRFIGNFNLTENSAVTSDKKIVSQILKVLRLHEGDKIILSDGKTNDVLAEIIKINKFEAKFDILKKYKNKNEPDISVTLYCSVLKRENFKWVVQKATEVGVTQIVPIITGRTVKTSLNQERLEKIAKEAAEQSGRGMIPSISIPQIFKEAVESAKNNQFNLFFDPSGEKTAKMSSKSAKSIGIWTGPEGGWTDKELSEAKRNNFKIITLGKLTFRAETAAIIASYLSAN